MFYCRYEARVKTLELRLDMSFKTMMMMMMLVEIGAHFSGQGRAPGNKRRRSDWSRLHYMRCRCFIASSSCRLPPQQYFGNNAHADVGRLLFMTYNGWVMISVAVGAFIGYLGFGNSSPTKSVACH